MRCHHTRHQRTGEVCVALLLLFLQALVARPVAAEERIGVDELMAYDLQQLMEVTVVTAARGEQHVIDSARSISVITADELRRRNYRTTPEALSELVGIPVQETNYGGGAPIIRGLVGNQILILVDGVRLNNAIYRLGPNQYLNTVDIHQIERIEVVRGPGSVLYGSDALGGIVHIITRSPAPQEDGTTWVGRLHLRHSTADHGTSGRVEMQGNDEWVGFVGGVSYKHFGDLRTGSDTGVQADTGYDEWDGDLKVELRLPEHQTLTAALQHVTQENVPRTDKLGPEGDLKREWDPESRDLYYLQYALDKGDGWISAAQASLSLHNQREEMSRITRSSPDLERENLDEVDTLGATLQLHSSLGESQRWTYGVDLYRDEVTSHRVDVDRTTGVETQKEGNFADGARYRSISLFVQDEVAIGNRLFLSLGGRYSDYHLEATVDDPLTGRIDVDGDAQAFTGSASAVYRVAPGTTLNVSVGQGFRAPNVDDMTILGSFGSGFEVPNPNLDPEQSINYEAGIKTQQPRFTGSFYVTRSDFEDLIVRAPATYLGLDFLDENGNGTQDPGEEAIFQRRNAGKARILGAEAEAQVRVADHWTLSGNLAWYKGEDLDTNEPLRRIPPLMGLFQVHWQSSGQGWIEYYNRFADRQDRLSPGDIDDARIADGGTPGYVTFNLRGGLGLGDYGDLTLALENLTDRTYRLHGSGINAPGFNIVAGYRVTF